MAKGLAMPVVSSRLGSMASAAPKPLQLICSNFAKILFFAGRCPADLHQPPLELTRFHKAKRLKEPLFIRMVISYFLRREERSKEASTPSKASPYMGRMQLISRAGSLHQSFGMALGPLPFAYAQGSPCFSTPTTLNACRRGASRKHSWTSQTTRS